MNRFPEFPRRTQYLLLSHVMGRASADGQIPNRVRMEQAMATVLGCGLCVPLHIKTLKSLIGKAVLPPTSYQFVRLLVAHRAVLCRRGPLVLLVDSLPDLRPQHQGRFCGLLQRLLQGDIEVLLVEHHGFLTRLRYVQWYMSTEDALRLHISHLQCSDPGEGLPTAVTFAPVRHRRPGAQVRSRFVSPPGERSSGVSAHA